MKSTSIYSDANSTSARSVAASIPVAHPLPAYIASTPASQLITSELEEQVAVSHAALALVNNFLDQVLFNILASAQSTTLSQLRTAIPIVLKPRLGKAALKIADDELSEYLEESDDEDPHPMQLLNPEFDLDLAWRLARLRCMVYTRLGDLEEEDEEEILEQEQLNRNGRRVRQATHLGPASAIFLTAVLEYLGEQALYYAAQHAQRRSESSKVEARTSQSNHADDDQSLVVEEGDMSQIGRESPLSRLWRSWRRDTRLPRGEVLTSTIDEEHTPSNGILQEKSPQEVPLPTLQRDVEGIERPSSAQKTNDGEGAPPSSTDKQSGMRRPASMTFKSDNTAVPSALTPTGRPPNLQEGSSQRPNFKHRRSQSLPTPSQTSRATSRNKMGQETAVVSELDFNEEGFASVTTAQKDTLATSQSQTTPQRSWSPEDDQQVGRVAAALSAVAGALGMGAQAAETGSPESQTESASNTMTRTTGEQMLGPSSSGAAPRDAATGPSITSIGDFNGIHVPEAVRSPSEELVSISNAGTSDPEDLALSSGDEVHEEMVDSARASQSAQSPQTVADDSFYNDSDLEESQQSTDGATESSPTVRQKPADYDNKNARRQATIYHESLAQSFEAPGKHQRLDTDLSQFPIPGTRTQQDSGSPTVASLAPSALSSNGKGDGVVGATRSTVADENRTPPSPNYRQDPTKDRIVSRSSPLSLRVRGSSGASTKFPGFDREQQEHKSSVVPQGSVIIAGSPSDVARKRGHLRLRTDSQNGEEEDTTKKRSLEQLIDSDETLHYTLTPMSARAEQVCCC